MALTVGGSGGATILYGSTGRISSTHLSIRRPILIPQNPSGIIPFAPRISHIAAASKRGSKIGKFDSRNRRGSTTTTKEQEDFKNIGSNEFDGSGSSSTAGTIDAVDDGYFLPDLPGLEPDFFEGPQWDGFGFFVQYLWAFGIVFALVACGIAVSTFNEGATDFKATPAFKESIQSRGLLEEPEASNSDVFESNPTEVAPSLE